MGGREREHQLSLCLSSFYVTHWDMFVEKLQ